MIFTLSVFVLVLDQLCIETLSIDHKRTNWIKDRKKGRYVRLWVEENVDRFVYTRRIVCIDLIMRNDKNKDFDISSASIFLLGP